MGLICAIDSETTGLIPGENELHSLAVIPLDENFMPHPTIPMFYGHCAPVRVDKISVGALKVTGQTAEQLLAYPPRKQMVEEFVTWFKTHVVANGHKNISVLGHNWTFDSGMIRHWLRPDAPQLAPMDTLFDYRVRDTQQIALFILDKCKRAGVTAPFSSAALRNIAKGLGISMEEAHDAPGDAMACAMIYKMFIEP